MSKGWWMTIERDCGTERVKVEIDDIGLNWHFLRRGLQCTDSLPVSVMLAIHNEDKTEETSVLEVHYADFVFNRNESVQIKLSSLKFTGTKDDTANLATKIGQLLKKEYQRPKKVLVFVNPGSGNRNSESVYRRIVGPTMDLCGVKTTVLVTTHTTHFEEYLELFDLDSVDGIVVLGGDGSLMHAVNGLMTKSRKDQADKVPESKDFYVKAAVPVGNIPTGSACSMGKLANGASLDPLTATISMILGKTTSVDLTEIIHDEEFVGYSLLFQTVGLTANVMVMMERMRWLGTLRHMFIAPAVALLWRPFLVEIEYLPVPQDEQEFALTPEAQNVCSKRNSGITTDGTKPGWKVFKGYASDATLHTFSQYDSLLNWDNQRYTLPILSSGKSFMSLIKTPTVFSTIATYRKCRMLGKAHIPACMIEQAEVKECRVKLISPRNRSFLGDVLSNDGECIGLTKGLSFQTKVHTGLLEMYCIDNDLVQKSKVSQKENVTSHEQFVKFHSSN